MVDFGDCGVRVGTDVQSIDEVAASIETFGAHYLQRLFTDHEVHHSGGSTAAAAPGLAARFAAKEAAMKVLRPTDEIPTWRSIEVRSQAGGWTELELSDVAGELAVLQGLSRFSVSLSHGAGVAMATVVAICVPVNSGNPTD